MFIWADIACVALGGLSAAAAAAIDRRTMRIPNRLTFPLILSGLALMMFRCMLGYPMDMAILTGVISYGLVYGLWRCHLWGGGDAKLVLALFLLLSPGYPPLYFIAAYTLCLALALLLKHGVYMPARRAMADPSPASTKGGPLSAEDIASLKEGPGMPMGPSLLFAYVSSVVLLGALPW
ncbi:MAG TPA: A24 family peptidase [Methanocella sp.]|uniref:A24 family peptidase n=1 Tax=Methanocella sp. TaxID=2052833 RepID=UPI002C4A99AD|nr:A24 family peptidase [Methanocella sp.]HTY90859.1 A24 family peptidase [Methanocella sp.]